MADASLTQRLLQRNAQPVDARARQRTVLHWVDWIACVAAGARSPAADALARYAPQPDAPRHHPSLIGMAHDAHHAMLMDAGPANVEEMDDMHRQAILHPGPVVIPAIAGIARSRRLAAGTVLDALVRGYETTIRIGRAVGRRHYFYWHNTATAGSFGAAAACASALGLDETQGVWALGNAGTQAAGLWQVRLEPVMSKQLHTGHAAWAGFTSAHLALAGFTGPQHILEGERGFFAAMCEGADLSVVTREERDWLIHETSFKPWPACRHTHATIDCALALREQAGDAPLRFESCTVETFGDAIAICNNPQPTTRTEAKFSLQYCVAAAARFGPLAPHHFDAEQFADPTLQADAARVAIAAAPDIDARYSAHYGARVRMVLADGRTVSHEVQDSLGDPERPLSTEAVFDKATQLMRYGGVAPERAEAVLRAAESLLRAVTDNGTGAAAHGPMSEAFPDDLLRPLFASSATTATTASLATAPTAPLSPSRNDDRESPAR
ncbi:MAG: MmgE/PrpD family protein [Gammaproteobacteria bacterium]|nr:MmgE/PrpD family protein [Gammaproteobacteria bacterium]